MAIYLATKTLAKINHSIRKDQGNSYRAYLGRVIPHIGDAYRQDESPFRGHLGASGIGDSCARKIWYSFRWSAVKTFDGRILRLFNRGHLEEARFIAMLLSAGIDVYQQDADGNQFRISDAGGHFGGSGDGVLIGVPDVPEGLPCLGEFKTSGEKPFFKLKKEGMRKAKFEHFIQVQCYMRKMGLAVALYMVVNKNTDELYAEIVPLDTVIADEFISRGVSIVFADTPPTRISDTPGWYECKWCDFSSVCHQGKAPMKTCRSCKHSRPHADGQWYCENPQLHRSPKPITTQEQIAACPSYERKF